jgi:2,5-diketo-D-gluconate reductase A
MERLGLDVLDLLLIHWPVPELDRYVETWHAFEKLYADGRVRAIGVSNFHIPHLQRLFDEGSVVPAINQIELHPQLPQDELRAFHAEHGIVTEAWSPLARGGAVLSDGTVTAIADRVGKSPAQVVLRWSLQLGNVVLPRSVTPSRIAENLELFDFSLTDEDMAALAGLADDERIGPNPDTFNRV